jgi:hypothetical protein
MRLTTEKLQTRCQWLALFIGGSERVRHGDDINVSRTQNGPLLLVPFKRNLSHVKQ